MQSRLGTSVGAAILALAVVVLPGPWGRTPTPGPMNPEPWSQGIGDPERGAHLFRELDCMRCHTEPRTGRGINVPASLREAGSRSRPEWVAAYLLEPEPLRYRSEGKRPRSRMPALVKTPEDARDLAALLSTWRDTVLVPQVSGSETWASDPALVAEGRMLFDQYQCRGCHRLAGTGGEVGPALDGVGDRRRADYVFALLEDPDKVIPGTSMEDKNLWPEEARSITEYLMTFTAGAHTEEINTTGNVWCAGASS